MSYNDADGIRRSDLWRINKSPLHYIWYTTHKKPTSNALQFGAAAHAYILERESFYEKAAIIPDVNRRTKEGRAEYEEFMNDCKLNDKIPITMDDFNTIAEMCHAIIQNPLAKQLLTGEHEREFYWTDDMTGEKCKCKVDCLTEYDGKPYIVDYKTTDSCEDGHFERSARKYGYQFQAGMYCEGLFQNTLEEYGFAFVAQEKAEPYAVRVYICDPEWIKRGYDKFRELIGIYHECKVTGNWYGYEGPDGIPVELVEG